LVLASVERELASKKKVESDALTTVQLDLKEARKQVSNLTNQLIGGTCIAQGHQNQMELNEQRQTTNAISHAAKLGTIVHTKADLLLRANCRK
jgi:hypothetical protein